MTGKLIHTPAEVVHQWALLVGLIADTPWNVSDWKGFINNSPSNHDNVVSISDTTGIIQGKTHVDSLTQQFYGIQFSVKANQQAVCWAKANEILRETDRTRNFLVLLDQTEYRISALTATSPIIAVGKEQPEDFMFLYTLNVLASIRIPA